MVKLSLTCRYCDRKWETTIYSEDANLHFISCLKCSSKDIVVKRASEEHVDYYVGCPPFPEKPVPKVEEPVKPSWIPTWTGNTYGSVD